MKLNSYLRLSILFIFAFTPLLMGASNLQGRGCGQSNIPANVTLTSITIIPSTSSIALGATQQFSATGTYSDNSTANITSSVTWSSSNSNIATLNATGLATSFAVGSTTITASLDSISSNSASLDVKQVYAYLANVGNNTVSICPVKINGTLDTCSASTGNGTFNQPIGVTFSTKGFAYIPNIGNNTVSICGLKSDGSFDTCSVSTGDGNFITPDAVALNADNTFLYVSNLTDANGSVSSCVLNSDGSIGTCTRNVDVSFDFVQGVAVLGNFAYVSNFSSVISICLLNANGTLGTCTTSDGNGTFVNNEGIAFNTAGTSIYVSTAGANLSTYEVSTCPVNSDGSLGTCISSNGSGTFDFSHFTVAVPFVNETYGYVPNSGGSLSICAMNVSGTFGTCTSTTDPSFNIPSTITLQIAP